MVGGAVNAVTMVCLLIGMPIFAIGVSGSPGETGASRIIKDTHKTD